MIEVIDLVNDDAFYMDKFYQIAHEAEKSAGKLSNNYKNIIEEYKKYECFTLVLEDDEPIAFSGLKKFSDGIGRVCSRAYHSNSVKHKTMGNRWADPANRLSCKYMIPFQLDFARKNNYSHVFVSFQSDLKRYGMIEILKNYLNEDTDGNWERLIKLYNTCKGLDDTPQCWQYIVKCTINEDKQWNLTCKDYTTVT